MSEVHRRCDTDAHEREPRTVLVTGASTGIGRRITEYLAVAGHRVYAGARKERDLRLLATIDNVTALHLDVLDMNDIDAAVARVRADGCGLDGLVNNAGIATVGSIGDGSMRELELTMSVNALAPYRVTRAFLPLIRAARGRIVMVGSIAGILSEPNLSAYSMSKHALEAFADALARETQSSGVHVSVIEAGGFRAELGNSAWQRLGSQTRLPDLSGLHEPDAVVSAVSSALFAARPKRRYLVVTSADEARQTIAKQIEQLAQLNEDHAYSYSRAEIVAMLDTALRQSGQASVSDLA